MSSNRETGDLYCESYEKVAVLFASIPGFMQTFIDDSVGVGEECLEKLNLIISSFDRVIWFSHVDVCSTSFKFNLFLLFYAILYHINSEQNKVWEIFRKKPT